AIRDLYIPAFAQDYIFENNNSREIVTTTAKIPVDFGEINFIVPEVGIKKQDNFWLVEYPQQSLVGENGWIQIGKTQYYTFKINQAYKPSTSIPFPFNSIKVVIPRDIQTGEISQKVYF